MTILPDMSPPDREVEPYDVPRGTCRTCGSGDVRHHIIGMPAGPDEMGSTPDWVEWEGCLHPGYTRSCRACGSTWLDDDDLDDVDL